MKKYGTSSLSDEEIIAIILKTGTKDINSKELALNILQSVENINELANITVEKLISIKGIGEAKATAIMASLELGKRVYETSDEKDEKYSCSLDIYKGNKYLFLNEKQEFFYAIYLDSKNYVLKKKLLFIGTINKSIIHPREIFKYAYLTSACKIVCLHNHPSGDVTPSQDDIVFTKAIIEIGKLQNIPVIDHLIIGNNKYYSFMDNNILN